MKAGNAINEFCPGESRRLFWQWQRSADWLRFSGCMIRSILIKGVISAAVFLLYVMMAGKCAGNFKDDRRTAVLYTLYQAFTWLLRRFWGQG